MDLLNLVQDVSKDVFKVNTLILLLSNANFVVKDAKSVLIVQDVLTVLIKAKVLLVEFVLKLVLLELNL